MLEILLATLSSLLPQEPQVPTPAATESAPEAAAAAESTERQQPARWLPDTTMVAITVEPVTAGGDIDALLAGDAGQQFRDLAGRLLQPGLAQLQMSFADLGRIARDGVAIGFVGFTAGQKPNIVLVAHLGGAAPALADRLVNTPVRDGLHVVGQEPATILVGTREGHVAFGSDAQTIREALDRAVDGTGPSLADQADYQRSLADGAGEALAHVFVRIGDLATAVVDRLPREVITPVRRGIDVLGLDEMNWASARCAVEGDDLVTRWHLDAPRMEGLVAALCGTAGRIDAGLARCVPTAADNYGFFTLDFGTVFDEVLALANSIQPAMAQMALRQLDQFSDHAGVDVRATIVGGLAGRMVTFSVPGDVPEVCALLEVRQGTTFGRALEKLVAALPVRLEQGTSLGMPCWRVARDDGIAPAFAVFGNWLAIGSSDKALDTAARQLQQSRPDAAVLEFVRSLPPDATSAAVAPVASSWGLSALGLPPATEQLGSRHLVVRRTPDAITAEERAVARDLLRGASSTMTALMTPGGGEADDTDALAANDGGDAARILRDAEAEGSTRANVTALAALLANGDAAVVARACYVLGQWQAQDAAVVLADIARGHADADARLQATAALARIGGTGAAQALAQVVNDADARVRTCAIQALGRIGGTTATAPALSLLERQGSTRPKDTGADLVAALVVLHDAGEPTNLMPAASSVGFQHAQVGQALTFLFQGLSPRLQPKDEVTTLLAVLDHPEPMLRRYAIQRLGELREPTTAKALEGRLAAETADLQPLIRVSLTQVRGDGDHGEDDLVARAKGNVTAISQMVERRWNGLGTTGRIATAATLGVVLLAIVGIVLARRRARRNAQVVEAQNLVAPSAGYAASGRHEYEHQPDEATVGVGADDERF